MAVVDPEGGVDVYFEQFGGTLGEEFDGVGYSGDESAFAHVEGNDGFEALDGCNAVDAEVDDKGVERGEVFAQGFVEGDEVGGEVGALSQLGGAVGGVLVVGFAVGSGGEVYGVEGLGDVELTQLPVESYMR